MAKNSKSVFGRNLAVLAVVACVWLVLDVASKQWAVSASGGAVGTCFAGPLLGLVDFRLAFNTGMAWSLFSGNPVPLGLFSLAICALILVYVLVIERESSLVEMVGLALVFSGGLGNAIDRFAAGQVTDFINFTFMSFPVFNVADMGVTCGVVIFLVGFLVCSGRRERARAAQAEAADAEGSAKEGE